jgi:hypothetical protein
VWWFGAAKIRSQWFYARFFEEKICVRAVLNAGKPMAQQDSQWQLQQSEEDASGVWPGRLWRWH